MIEDGRSLSERIAEREVNNTEGRNDKNRAAFILARGEVSKAVEDGFSLLVIYETLYEEGRIPFTYQTFRRYAGQLLPARPGRLRKREGK